MARASAVRWAAFVVAVLVASGCGGDDESSQATQMTSAPSVVPDEPEGADTTDGEDSNLPPLERLAEIASTVTGGGFSCDSGQLNEQPDGANTYSASMSCWRGSEPHTEDSVDWSVYLDDTNVDVGEPCDAAEHSFVDDSDVWQADFVQDDVLVQFEALGFEVDSPAEVVETLEDFAAAAGWDVTVTCAPPR